MSKVRAPKDGAHSNSWGQPESFTPRCRRYAEGDLSTSVAHPQCGDIPRFGFVPTFSRANTIDDEEFHEKTSSSCTVSHGSHTLNRSRCVDNEFRKHAYPARNFGNGSPKRQTGWMPAWPLSHSSNILFGQFRLASEIVHSFLQGSRDGANGPETSMCARLTTRGRKITARSATWTSTTEAREPIRQMGL